MVKIYRHGARSVDVDATPTFWAASAFKLNGDKEIGFTVPMERSTGSGAVREMTVKMNADEAQRFAIHIARSLTFGLNVQRVSDEEAVTAFLKKVKEGK